MKKSLMNKLFTKGLFVLPVLSIVSLPLLHGCVSSYANESEPVISQSLKARLQSTSFVTVEADHPTEGGLTVVEADGQLYLDFASDFKSTEGPDLKVVLHKDPTTPLNVKEADYIEIAPLESLSGAQSYAIPEDIDLESFKSVAIWCEQFNVTFGYATLQ